MLGAKTAETPHWFKESFLEFEEDVAEAAADGKRVMIFFHQEGAPIARDCWRKVSIIPTLKPIYEKTLMAFLSTSGVIAR